MEMIRDLTIFLTYAVLAVFAENAVFTRGLGVSRLIRLVNDDAVGTFQFWVLLALVELLTAPMGFFVLNRVIPGLPAELRLPLRPLLYLGCALVAYLIVLGFLCLAPFKHKLKLLRTLPLASFNTNVLGTLIICSTQGYTLMEHIGFGVGTSLGYLMAVLLVDEAERRLDNDTVPAIFRGMPITLVYIGILALAIYGFTGHTITL